MIRLSLATPDDDATLRALLRDNPMPSWVSMALTREPSFFAGANRFGREWAVLGRVGGNPGNAGDAGDAGEAGNSGTTSETGADGAGAVADDVVGMYACAEQPLHWNGVETAMAYLAGLRVAPRYRHRLRILKAGYASIRRFAHGRHSGPWFTAIASENLPARRLLEAGLRGLPRYRPLNEMVTLALPRARGRRHGAWRRAVDDDLADLCRFYNRQACRYQCAPALNPARVGATGASFYCLDGAAGLAAVMALWNQQDYKQVRACAYRPPLGALRPLYNGYARLAKRILLPSPGQALDQAFLAFFAVARTHENEVLALIEDALALCPTAVMSFGLHAGHRWLEPVLARFRPASYRTWIYAVDLGEAVSNGDNGAAPDGRPAQPEVAVL